MREIIYEPHPVTPERKAELRAQGYKIIDAVFAPIEADQEQPEKEQPEKEQPKRGRKAKA